MFISPIVLFTERLLAMLRWGRPKYQLFKNLT